MVRRRDIKVELIAVGIKLIEGMSTGIVIHPHSGEHVNEP
jgi:hypothetical protein